MSRDLTHLKVLLVGYGVAHDVPLRTYCEEKGCTVSCAASSHKAMAQIAKVGAFDCALLWLPVAEDRDHGGGLADVRQIRQAAPDMALIVVLDADGATTFPGGIHQVTDGRRPPSSTFTRLLQTKPLGGPVGLIRRHRQCEPAQNGVHQYLLPNSKPAYI